METLKRFKHHMDSFSNHFVKCLSDEGSQQLENTKNIPRLYRRTNRDVSTKECSLDLNCLRGTRSRGGGALVFLLFL